MNTFATVEIARHEQEARVRHAMHVRALKAYQREHPVQHQRREKLAALLRSWATRIDGRTTAAAPRTNAPRVTQPASRLSTR
jgi:hypothetical protein